MTDEAVSYTVLARRYRPTRLNDLVGQDVLQKTLTEAIEKNHLPHAILLHGIRGVGKTTTARIIARALNCLGSDGKGNITANPCGVCASCLDIQNDRHIDIVEMDAASHTSIDNIRVITDSARYKAVKGRFKIFIIDEVHMLSKSAFNGLLKTLEEPPAHVKFIFATTEIRKIPDTILSRCMRFDLKRIDAPVVLSYMESLCEKEKIKADRDALGILARAADGSMRDGLSLLDQAIALSLTEKKGITSALVQTMLGATNSSHIFDLLQGIFKGDATYLIEKVEGLFLNGADPLLLLQDVLECLYWMTCLKHQPSMMNDPTWPLQDRSQAAALLEGITMGILARSWQVLSKGYEEVQKNPLPKQACLMVILRLCYISTLPSLERVIEMMGGNDIDFGNGGNSSNGQTSFGSLSGVGGSSHVNSGSSSLSQRAEDHTSSFIVETVFNKEKRQSLILDTSRKAAIDSSVTVSSLADLVKLLKSRQEILLATQLEQEVRVLSFRQGEMVIAVDTNRLNQLPQELRQALNRLTGHVWTITVKEAEFSSQVSSVSTLYEEEKIAEDIALSKAKETPLLKEILNLYPKTLLTVEKSYEAI